MAKNKYAENLKNKPQSFWDALISLEAYIGVVISATQNANTATELYRLTHFIYWTAPEPDMSFEEAVAFLQAQISSTPRKKRKELQKAARAKLRDLSGAQIRALLYGNGLEAVEKSAFYKSWEWRTLRMRILREHGARCQCCGATSSDYDTAGNPIRLVVDHVKPLSKFWELRLEPSNLQVLCDECNMGKGAWDQTDWRPG